MLTERGEALRTRLMGADVAPLLMVYVQLSGERDMLARMRPFIDGPWAWNEHVPVELKTELCERTASLLEAIAAGRTQPAAPPDTDLLAEMTRVCVGGEVPPDYLPLVAHDMQLAGTPPLDIDWRSEPPARALAAFRVLIIGAGESGLCMAIKLARMGIAFTIIEKNSTVGGTWFENSYPGCGVDTPNHFYQYSFAPNHDWSRHFSPAMSCGDTSKILQIALTCVATSDLAAKSLKRSGMKSPRAGAWPFAAVMVRQSP